MTLRPPLSTKKDNWKSPELRFPLSTKRDRGPSHDTENSLVNEEGQRTVL